MDYDYGGYYSVQQIIDEDLANAFDEMKLEREDCDNEFEDNEFEEIINPAHDGDRDRKIDYY